MPLFRNQHLASVALCVLASGCYLAHERDSGFDAAVVDAPMSDGFDAAAPASDGATCSPGVATTVRLEPPLDPGHIDYVRIIGVESPPARADVVLHLDTCPMADAPCPHDAFVGAMGTGFAFGVVAQVPAPGFRGFLDWDGHTLHVLFIDGRLCASCGGELEILAGDLVAPLSAAVHTHDGDVRCANGCGDDRAIAVESHGTTIMGSQSGTTEAMGMTLWVTSDEVQPCVRCTCAAATVPATGLYVGADGVFAVH